MIYNKAFVFSFLPYLIYEFLFSYLILGFKSISEDSSGPSRS